MHVSTARKLRMLLSIICGIAPMKPNKSSLAQERDASKTTMATYRNYRETTGMIGLLRDDTKGLRSLGKVEKVYLDNTNLMYALASSEPNVGNVRETFFFNQMKVRNNVLASRISDFSIGDMTFEVGGAKKGKKQIASAQHGFVVKDDIRHGFGNVIPLWHFGMNY